MDGYEATRRIKASPDSRDTMVIAVTASAFEEDRYKTFAAGADAYLAKPFKDTELFETIGRLTGADYLYREPAGTGSASPAADDRADIHRSVAGLPAETVDRLRSAIEGADIDRLNELCAQMDADHPLLSQRVREMAARYEYEALTEIFSAQE
jgi:CheY-like chemotaxis protein